MQTHSVDQKNLFIIDFLYTRHPHGPIFIVQNKLECYIHFQTPILDSLLKSNREEITRDTRLRLNESELDDAVNDDVNNSINI